MNTQEILTRVNDALGECTPGNVPYYLTHKLQTLSGDLEAQLRREIAASKGVGNAAKVISAMLKAQESSRKSLSYPWIDGEGRQCACDGFQAYRLREHLPLVDRPDDAGEPVDLARVFPASLDGWKRLPMPSVKELRAFIAVERSKHPGRRKADAIWDFGPHAPSVNAQYLLNAATVFPNAAELFWNTLVSPVVLTCEQGDAVVLPIRTDKTMEQPTDDECKAIEAENAQKERNARYAKERADTMRQAREDAAAALEDSKNAQYAQAKALHDAKEADTAQDAAAKDAAMQAYYDACEAEGKARLRQHAATLVFDPTLYMEPVDFAAILGKLYVRERNAA